MNRLPYLPGKMIESHHNWKSSDKLNISGKNPPKQKNMSANMSLFIRDKPIKSKEDCCYYDPLYCPGCELPIEKPFIICMECSDYVICVECFAKGFEEGTHKKTHSYMVEDVDNKDGKSDSSENKIDEEDESSKKTLTIDDVPHIPWYPCEKPFRPIPHSKTGQNVQGYIATRGEFLEEYDDDAEKDICFVEPQEDDPPIIRKCGEYLLESYLIRLEERNRRRQIVRNFGLINLQEHENYVNKLDEEHYKVEKELTPFMKFHKNYEEFKVFRNNVCLERSLIARIKKLQNYRKLGLQSFAAVEDYELRLAKRKKQIEGHYKNNLLSKVIPIIHNPRKCRELRDQIIADSMEKYPPNKSNQQVDKNGRLNSLEEKFCADNGIVIQSYLEYKRLLIKENEKRGSLKLSDARNILKINVTLTGKIYNFLLANNYVKKA